MKTFLVRNRKKMLISFILAYVLLFIIVNKQNQIFRYLYAEKVWVHRVNSIEKLTEVNALFKGVELDVMFLNAKGTFDVNHPPAKSIDLSLFTYLSSIEDPSLHHFWLDFKNLTPSNKESSYIRLDSILGVLNLKKQQFIIESRTPENLDVFINNGYKTSYYFPSRIYKLNAKELEEKVKAIKHKLTLNKTDYISANLDHYSIMKNRFSKQKILTWPYKYEQESYYNPITLLKKLKNVYYKYKVLSNDKVHAVLFTYEAKKGNR